MNYSGPGRFVLKIKVFLTIFMLVLAWGGDVRAQPISPTCDPDVYDVHQAHSWMGGKRQFETAQTLIHLSKDITFRDSILYMSCFDHHMREMPERDNVLFSDGAFRFVSTGAAHGTLFRMPPLCFGPTCAPIPWLTGALIPNPINPLVIVLQMPIDIFQPLILPEPGPNPPGPLMDDVCLDRAVTMLVRWSLRPYWRENFVMHRPATPLPMPPTVICGSMAEIWQEAKCSNINKDNWLTYDQHVCGDRRGCEGCRGNWANALEVGNPLPVDWPATGPGVDRVIEWVRDTFYAPSCASVPPVRTGVAIMFDGALRQDAVCPGINCWYDYNNLSCND